ncbi:division plane positioning ATPase MipZ [Aquisediminimonas sediminicola]|uniref:division plane positioning ATPase MipZ n=1 Tax=Alteraquisediminimonas sediminicola TaxID=2676787 RepID=UPI001C8E5069|nr:division plane positioning ATPase MipZ [Aquisediminimonas sediminicola]
MTSPAPHIICFANEKGGTGKSTTAVHVAVALSTMGYRVAAIDLDHRQRTLVRYLENREASVKRLGQSLPLPRYRVYEDTNAEDFMRVLEEFGADADFVIIDTPGRDDPVTRVAVTRANTLVTPINDSFIDLDLIGQVDPETFKVRRPSFYAELIWEARKVRAKTDGVTVDWVVLRNRLQHVGARNMTRVANAMEELARRVGFRIIPGLSERVIYRELFPAGLTLLDLGAIEGAGMSHISARQELREMISALGITDGVPVPAAAADAVPA